MVPALIVLAIVTCGGATYWFLARRQPPQQLHLSQAILCRDITLQEQRVLNRRCLYMGNAQGIASHRRRRAQWRANRTRRFRQYSITKPINYCQGDAK